MGSLHAKPTSLPVRALQRPGMPERFSDAGRRGTAAAQRCPGAHRLQDWAVRAFIPHARTRSPLGLPRALGAFADGRS